MTISDDFSGGVLDPVWRIEGPLGVSSALGVTGQDAWLALVTPDGTYDAWNTNTAARAMQTTADDDFQLEARFLSLPATKYQGQGFLAEQDAQNWVRYDTYSDGSKLFAFAAVTVNGVSTMKFKVAIPGNVAPHLQMVRVGDVWTMKYSTDGATWVTAGSFSHALTVTATGVFASNSSNANGFTALVDYFETGTDPIQNEDGTIVPPNAVPLSTDDSYQLASDGTLSVAAEDGVLRNDRDPEGGVLAVTLGSSPAHGTVTLNADGSFSYSANAGYTGPDSFAYTVTDALGATATATVSLQPDNTAPVLVTGTSAFSKTVVSTAMPLTHIALAADFDLDGDLDIVATSEQDDSVVWFENDGNFGFTRRVIDNALESAYPASLADLDLDGDTDVLVGGYRADQYVWYENAGDGTFTKRFIATQDGAHSIFAVDMDGDGDLDLITAGQDSNTIAWYENNGSQSFTPHLINAAALAAKSAVAFDMDADGDLDVVAASFADDTIAWYENDGDQNFSRRVIDAAANGAYFATVADIDGDGDRDVVAASQLDNSIAWYSNSGGVFTKRLIAADANAARFVSTGDIDGDGDIDILSASVDDNTIALYRNDGAGAFTRIIVDGQAIGAYGAIATDMDGDGLIDVLGASKTDGKVSILFQQKAHQLAIEAGSSLVIDTARLQAVDADQSAAGLVYRVVTAPTAGQLRLDGIVLGANGTFTQQDVNLGRVSYQQTAAGQGSDSFVLSLSDGIAPASTAAFSVSIAGANPVGAPVSDDFSGGVLDPVWRIEGPAGVSSSLGTAGQEAWLALVTPDGTYDAWNTNTAARAMQTTADDDFQLEARFLSLPATKYQGQGFLAEQDAQNWLRYDTFSDGRKLYAFAAVTVDGVSTQKFKVAIAGNVAPFLQMVRAGDVWTMKYSTDGTTWVTAGSFTHAMTVSATGVFASNSSNANGFTALVDYFETSTDPIQNEDGSITPVNLPPVAGDDALTTAEDSPLTFAAATLLGNDSDPNGTALSITAITQPANGTLTNLGNGSYTYTPTAGFSGSDSFTYTVSDGTLTDTATVAITVTPEQEPGGGPASDDFSAGVLDPVWRIEGPAGVSSALGTSAQDAWLALVTPDGTYDAWNTNTAARAMQTTADDDFQLEARFLSLPATKYQGQGFLAEQDAQNWLRYDTFSDGRKLYAFAAVTVDGVSTQKFKVAIAGNVAPFLQMVRAGDVWTMKYSTDGTTWVTAGSFTHAMTVSATGVFASNSSNANGFTALVDYFETGTDPIQNEDGTITPVNLPPVAGDDALTTAEDSPLTFAAATLLGNDSDPNGTALSITAITQPANGTLTNLGNGSYTYTPTAGFSGSDSFTYTVSDGTLTDTATVTVLVGNPINVWYGLEQSFGAPGEGQRMINILGNVGDDVVSLSYSLNGAAFQTLSIGADTRRLQNPGDFNIDIDYARLNGTAVDDVVTIRATLGNGQIYTRDVIVNYQAGQTWAPNYSIDWATVTNLQDVVQVADGTWAHSAAGVRPVDLGYDRLLVLGDQAWDNYEARLTITMHNLTNEDPRGRDGGSLMLGALWDGHTDDPIRNWQPKSGWEPGTIFQYNTPNAAFSIYSYDDYRVRLDREPFVLQEGHTYNFTLRVEQTGLYDRLYSLKVWEVGTSEPVGWTVQGLETFTLAERPATGSLYLNAHYYDVTFGDIAVTEITGRDIIQGDSTAERLVAVNPGSAAPGRGEIDVFVGDGGADVFVFGDANGRYYDDGNAQNAGQGDYAFVWDFVSGTDQIELAGSAANYLLTSNAAGLPAGTAIWWDNAAGPDELIAVLNGVYGLNLGSSDFRFTETLLV